jgi:hypothetical protein
MAPHSPQRSERPGEPVALLGSRFSDPVLSASDPRAQPGRASSVAISKSGVTPSSSAGAFVRLHHATR